MKHSVPVLPTKLCFNCPCNHQYICRVTPRRLLLSVSPVTESSALLYLRSHSCLADEIAWRNVFAGLGMVARRVMLDEEAARLLEGAKAHAVEAYMHAIEERRLHGELVWRGWTSALCMIAMFTLLQEALEDAREARSMPCSMCSSKRVARVLPTLRMVYETVRDPSVQPFLAEVLLELERP